MRATELSKKGSNYKRGLIMMTVDGTEAQVRKVEKELDKHFTNTMCEEEGDNEGEISISYEIDRNEKKEFMSVYNAAKTEAQ